MPSRNIETASEHALDPAVATPKHVVLALLIVLYFDTLKRKIFTGDIS